MIVYSTLTETPIQTHNPSPKLIMINIIINAPFVYILISYISTIKTAIFFNIFQVYVYHALNLSDITDDTYLKKYL